MIEDLSDLSIYEVQEVLDLIGRYELEIPETFGHTLDMDVVQNHLYFIRPDHRVLVWRADETIKGFLWLHKATLLISNEPFVGDVLFYVAPEYRGGKAASELLLAGQQWAKQKGAASFQMGAFSGINRSAEKLYSNMGMEHFGTTWIQSL